MQSEYVAVVFNGTVQNVQQLKDAVQAVTFNVDRVWNPKQPSSRIEGNRVNKGDDTAINPRPLRRSI